MAEFPDHCAGVALATGPTAAEIKLEPVGKQPSKRDQAETRRRLEQLSGVKMGDEDLASLMELVEQLPQPGPEDILRLADRP